MKKWLILMVAAMGAIILAACNDNEKDNEFDAKENAKTIEEGTVGFEVMGDNIEEVTNVPANEKKAIHAAFDEYIASFNAKDIDRYINTLSKNPQGFDYDEEVKAVKAAFKEYNVEKKASDVILVKYSDEEAQVFSNLDTNTKEIATGTELSDSGRQVTVFVKEDGAWKVSSIYYIGNDSK